MKKIHFISLLAFSLVALSNAGNYGMAGCGLGAVVMGKSGSQISASTTNGTFYNQFFGITSGTLECTDDGVALKEKELEAFASANHESLIQEMAQGEGETLNTLAVLYGCGDGDVQSFNQSLKSNYQDIYPSDDVNSVELVGNIDAVSERNNVCQERI